MYSGTDFEIENWMKVWGGFFMKARSGNGEKMTCNVVVPKTSAEPTGWLGGGNSKARIALQSCFKLRGGLKPLYLHTNQSLAASHC